MPFYQITWLLLGYYLVIIIIILGGDKLFPAWFTGLGSIKKKKSHAMHVFLSPKHTEFLFLGNLTL